MGRVKKADTNIVKTVRKKPRKINYDPHKSVKYRIEVKEHEWEKLKPEPVQRKDRNTYNLKKGWTHFIVKKLWDLFKIPCPFAFKKHAFPAKEGSPYLTFCGACHECGNTIEGCMVHEPVAGSQIFFDIDTYDTTDLTHCTSTNLAGDRREEEQKILEHTKPKRYEDEEAAKDDFDDDGDKPPYFVTKSIARTARQEVKDKKDGIDKFSRDPVTAILQQMYEEEAILEFFGDPLKVYYWLDNQIKLWNAAVELNIPISIDASGSMPKRPKVIDEQKSPPLFLYNVTIRIGTEVYSICQMFSSKHDAITIARWLEAWLNSGAEMPTQVFVDCSWALLGAICLVFNLCGYFEYIDKCHVYLVEYSARMKMKENPTDVIFMENLLPPCRIMRDRAHLIKSVCKWKVFSIGQNWTKKDFYVRAIAYCIEIVNTEELKKVFIALLVLCESQIREKGSNASDQYTYLISKIGSFQHETFESDNTVEQECTDEHCSFLKEFDASENVDLVPSSACDVKSYVLDLKKSSQEILDKDKNKNYTQKNPYWLPGIKNNLLRLFKEYPCWTNVTLHHYPFEADAVASSTASEVYFRILKVDYNLVRMSLQRFLLQHLKLLKGATRNGRRALKKLKSELEKKKANCTSQATVVESDVSVKSIEVVDTAKSMGSSLTKISFTSPATVINSDISTESIADSGVLKTVDVGKHSSKSSYIKKTVTKILASPMTHEGGSILNLTHFWEILRMFHINDGKKLKYDLLISFFNYNLPYDVKDNGCNLTLNAFLSLEQGQFLHGEVIDSIMSIFKHKSEWQDVFYIPTAQTTFIMGDQCHWEHPPEWIMYNLNFEFFGTVFLPFCYGLHWCLIMLDVKNQMLYYFDPKYNNTKSRAVEALLQFFAKWKKIYEHKYGNVKGSYLFQIDWKETIHLNDRDMKNLPIQLDSNNCGPFIIEYMATLSGIDQSITNFDPNMYRYCIANLLVDNFNTSNVTCLLCYNGRSGIVKTCIKCTRWAHDDCVTRWASKLSGGICEICS